MKKLLILLLTIITFFGYAQTKIDPALSPTTARINEAIQGSITASGTDTYTGTLTGLTNVTGKAYDVTFTNANTGSATFTLNPPGSAVTIRKFESGSLVNLASGDISAGETKRLRYNGTYLVIEGGTGSGGGGSPTLGTLTADPFNYPATGNSLDVFGNRTLGKLQRAFNDYSLPTITGLNLKIVPDGNSNTAGYGLSAGNDYPTLVYNLLGGSGAGYTLSTNFAVSGQTTQQMQADAVAQIDAVYDGSKTRNFLFAWEVENDIFINAISGATAATNMLTYWNDRQAAGFYVIGATSPLRGIDITVNNSIKAANTAIKAGTSNYDLLIDIPSIPILSNNRSSVGYQSDITHFNLSGAYAIRDAYASAVRTSLSQQDYTPPNFASWSGNTPDRSMLFGSLNSNAVGFITDGKVRGEFTTNGTFDINADVVGLNGRAQGLYVHSGLTADVNNDILSVATFRPDYYDINGKTGVVKDIVRIENSAGTIQSRWDEYGRFFWQPNFTALSSVDFGAGMQGSVTGFSSGTFTHYSHSPTFVYAANSTNYVSARFSPTITRGAFTGTVSTTVDINSGAAAIAGDNALRVTAVEGISVKIDHAGNNYGILLNTTTASTAIAAGNSGAGDTFNFYKTSGANSIGFIQSLSTSNLNGLVDMITYQRAVNSQTAGAGMSFKYNGFNSSDLPKPIARQDFQWIANTASSETSAVVWNTSLSGTLAERMRLEGGNLGIGTGATPTARVHIAAGTTTAGTGSLKLNEGVNPTTPEDGLINYVSDNITFTETSTVYVIPKTLRGSATLNFPSVASLSTEKLTITVTGASDGDEVIVGIPNGSQDDGIVWKWWVSGTNTVTIAATNVTLGAIDPASGTFKTSVIKR